ncbi:TIGR04222 domain-containing membrane protein [Nonomuraea typhae]|uniref:TIGR04222 domain-containing membrane protein n=1 Tax=Nonomuraea typhae TaxID=2603600 RepID=UPI0012FBDB63|nr:TIGR04222 domain-containing membrane protein [Nonomuraea typhae]
MVVVFTALAGLGLVATLFIAGVGLADRLRRNAAEPVEDMYELAVLIGGRWRLADTVLLSLVCRDAIRVSRDGQCTPVAGGGSPHPVDRVILGELAVRPGGVSRSTLMRLPAWEPVAEDLRRALVKRGLLRPEWVKTGVMLASLAMGGLILGGLLAGWSLVLTVGMIFTGGFDAALELIRMTGVMLVVVPVGFLLHHVTKWSDAESERTRYGQAALAAVRKRHPFRNTTPTALALYGDPFPPPARPPAPVTVPAPSRENGTDDACGGGGCGCGCGE